jgi:hypothetical protein
LSLSLLPIKAANILVMYNCGKISFQFPYMDGEQLLTLCGCLILGGSNSLTNNIAHKGSQYFDCRLCSLHSPCIMYDARPYIMYTQFHNAAVTVFLSLLPVKAANMLTMHNSEQITVQIPDL